MNTQSRRSAKYLTAKAKVDRTKVYAAQEAVALAKETSITAFDASVELHARIGIDTKKGEQQVRSTVVLPYAQKSSKRVAAFVADAKEAEARDAGADIVGGEALIEEINKTQKIDFDVAVATPDMMPKLTKIARVLGPKGLMPNPKTDTVGPDVKKMVSELKKGKIAFKNDDTANVHLVIGHVSQSTEELTANFHAAVEALKKAKPTTSKGAYLKALYITTTMGPSIKVTATA